MYVCMRTTIFLKDVVQYTRLANRVKGGCAQGNYKKMPRLK